MEIMYVAKKKKLTTLEKDILYHNNIAQTLRDIALKTTLDHEWAAHTRHNGLKRGDFTRSGYGWAIECMVLSEHHEDKKRKLENE